MQCDEVVWQVINQGHCAFRVKTVEQNFCRNENNVTGLCNRQSCPLANSRYATIREVEGKCYLFMKTIERSFSPAKMWEKIKLSSDYAVALQQLDEHLQYWPKYLVHKAKQRLTKITQYLVRMRKLKLKPKMKLVGITKKTEKREARREEKAERAAKIESSIESALLERLKKGTYGDIYNFPVEEYNKALDEEERLADEMELQDEEDGNVEFVEDFSDLDEDDLEDYDVPGVADFASDLDDEDDDDDDDDEDDDESDGDEGDEGPEDDAASESDEDSRRQSKPASKKGKGGALPKKAPKLPPKKGGKTRVEIEYETETSHSAHANYNE